MTKTISYHKCRYGHGTHSHVVERFEKEGFQGYDNHPLCGGTRGRRLSQVNSINPNPLTSAEWKTVTCKICAARVGNLFIK